jgi:hypothetical protein
MVHTLLLYRMAPGAPLEGMVLTVGPLANSEIVQRIKDVMEPTRDSLGAILDFMYPMSGHPLMRPDTGFVEIISIPLSPASFPSINFLSLACLTSSGVALAEGSHPYRPTGTIAQEGGKLCHEQGAKKGEGGQQKEVV